MMPCRKYDNKLYPREVREHRGVRRDRQYYCHIFLILAPVWHTAIFHRNAIPGAVNRSKSPVLERAVHRIEQRGSHTMAIRVSRRRAIGWTRRKPRLSSRRSSRSRSGHLDFDKHVRSGQL